MLRYFWILLLPGIVLIGCSQGTSPSEITQFDQSAWALQSMGGTPIPNPQHYLLHFSNAPDGGYLTSIAADCNTCAGTAETRGNDINISVSVCTEAFCGENSRDLEYLDALETATHFARLGNQLTLDYPGGEMIFLLDPTATDGT